MSLPIRNPQSAIPNRNDWLPIDQAAGLLAEPLRTLQHRCRCQWAKRGLAELRTPGSGVGKPTWWIHRAAHPRLDSCPDRRSREDCEHESLLARFPHHVGQLR